MGHIIVYSWIFLGFDEKTTMHGWSCGLVDFSSWEVTSINGMSKSIQLNYKDLLGQRHYKDGISLDSFFQNMYIISSLVKYMKNQEKWQVMTYKSWLVVSNICYFSIIYGMSSFPLTNSIIFQDG